MYAKGEVTVDCDTVEQAEELVQNQIGNGTLQTTHVKWDEPQYEDCSFEVDENGAINF